MRECWDKVLYCRENGYEDLLPKKRPRSGVSKIKKYNFSEYSFLSDSEWIILIFISK